MDINKKALLINMYRQLVESLAFDEIRDVESVGRSNPQEIYIIREESRLKKKNFEEVLESFWLDKRGE